VEQELMLRNVT